MNYAYLAALMAAAAAMLFDLKTGRIPNILAAIIGVTGIACHFMGMGVQGLFSFLVGASLPAVLLMPLFRFRMMGAGDIKLLMGLGGILGFPDSLHLLAWSFVLGGLLAAIQMALVTGFRERFQYFIDYVIYTIWTGRITPYRREGAGPENFPFTVPIFAAVAVMIVRKMVILGN